MTMGTTVTFELAKTTRTALARLHEINALIDSLESALDVHQKEVEGYNVDLDECHDRLRDIDEFVGALRAGEVSTVPDVASALVDMEDEREEEESAIKQYEEAREWHEQQFQKLQRQCVDLKKERGKLHKTYVEMFSIFWAVGVSR